MPHTILHNRYLHNIVGKYRYSNHMKKIYFVKYSKAGLENEFIKLLQIHAVSV